MIAKRSLDGRRMSDHRESTVYGIYFLRVRSSGTVSNGGPTTVAVSYTHLTLPTIYSV